METTLSKRLKRLRAERGWPQKEVIDRLGVTQTKYSAWESGEREPSLTDLKELAALYSMDAGELLREEGMVFNFQNSTNANGIGRDNIVYTVSWDELKEILLKHDEQIKRYQSLLDEAIDRLQVK